MKKSILQKVKVTGDIPAPRFGHTLTMVSSTKAVLFGGAVSVNGRFIITNESFLFDFALLKWTKLNFKQGFVPSQRAAHTAVMVSQMQMIIYGGAASGTQGLLKDQLYILDLRNQPVWKIIQVSNKNLTPGQRYGHTMVFNKPYLVVFGGNSGNKAQNDVWLLNILKGPFTWQKYQFPNKNIPCPRVYHSAAICQQGSALGMMVVFGGRKQTKKDHNGSQKQLNVAALNDVWGLRKHRDGSWDWVTPPKSETYTPICRYQHLVTFMGTTLIIVGGRSSNPQQLVDSIQTYDTQTSQWHKSGQVNRYRHSIALYDKTKLFIHGGFQPQFASQPIQTMSCIDVAALFKKQTNPNIYQQNMLNSNSQRNNMSQRGQLRQINDSQINIPSNSRLRSTNSQINKNRQRDLTPSRIINSSKSIRLSNQVVVAKGQNNVIQIQKVPVNSLLQESKRLTSLIQDSQGSDLNVLQLIDNVINVLLPQSQGFKTPSTIFPFKRDKIVRLCQQVSKIFVEQTSLIGVRAPAKVFGSLYGRFYDLIQVFQNFGFPDERQMESYEYVFLGNYVDKGFNSLETICLLMALKIKYPDHIRLLRGPHQDININRFCGLGEQCAVRLNQNINDSTSVFCCLNTMFQLLPLAAVIQDKYLCVNSGVGSVQNLVQIKNIVRPLKIKSDQVAVDLLWSQNQIPCSVSYKSKKCSEQQVQRFLDSNGIEMIIHTSDCLPSGLEQDRSMLGISTIANFNKKMNKGCILKLNKQLQIAPCILNCINAKKTQGLWINQMTMKVNIAMTQNQMNFRKAMFS